MSNMEDEVIRGATVVHNGEVTWPPPAPKLSAAPKQAQPAPAAPTPAEVSAAKPGFMATGIGMGIGGLLLLALGNVAPPSFMAHFTVFVLACFVGYMVIWNVPPAMHTPLMSVTNAISSIIVIGALVQISSGSWWVVLLSFLALLITSINIFGGFAVTQRMLQMFQK